MRGSFDIGWGRALQSTQGAFTFTVGGAALDPTDLVTPDHLALLAPHPDFPFFFDYAEVVPFSDWLAKAPPTDVGLFWLDEDLDVLDHLHVTSVFGVGGEMIHHATPTAGVQEAGDVTLRTAFVANDIVTTMTFVLASCQGVTDETAANDNALYEASLISPSEIKVKHESGTNVQHQATYSLPLDLRDGYRYEVAAVRESDVWRAYLDGMPLQWITDSAGGSDDGDGAFTATASPENGGQSVFSVERGRGRSLLVEAIGASYTAAEVADRALPGDDPRIALLGMSNTEILDIVETGTELLLLLPDEDAADQLIQRVGTLAGTWVDAPPDVHRILGGATWARGSGTTVGYQASSTATEVLVGGADYVYRMLGIWQDGDALSSNRRWFGNSTSSGSVNVHAFFYFTNNSTLAFLQQHGSKATSFATFTLPVTLQDGDPFVVTIEQRDNADGTQRISAWVNGQACPVASVSGATDNGDGTADLTDGSVNGATFFSWLAIEFGDATDSWGRLLQIDQATTTTAAELAIAQALGLAS